MKVRHPQRAVVPREAALAVRRCPTCRKRLKKRANCYEPRCVRARELALEALLNDFATTDERPASLCACGGNVTFGSDPMTGKALEWCDNCGERETATTGVRHYDQRERLERELVEFTDRAARHAQPRRVRLFCDPDWEAA